MRGVIGIERDVHDVRIATLRAGACVSEVIDDARADVEGRHVHAVGMSQTDTDERIDQGKRLQGLRRIEIVAFGLVHEVEAWADDRDAPDAARGLRARGTRVLQRAFDRVRGEHGRVRREAASLGSTSGRHRTPPWCRPFPSPTPCRAGTGSTRATCARAALRDGAPHRRGPRAPSRRFQNVPALVAPRRGGRSRPVRAFPPRGPRAGPAATLRGRRGPSTSAWEWSRVAAP